MSKLAIFILVLAIPFSVFGKNSKYTKQKPVVSIPATFLVSDIDGNILKEKDGEAVRPIASISKLMISILSSEQNLQEELEIPKTRTVTTIIPRSVKTLTRLDLLTLSLVRSDNLAAQILCANLENCVEKMNARAIDLGMSSTKFAEPTGLDRNNVSTAHDLVKLLLAVHKNSTVSYISSLPSTRVLLGKTYVDVRNTNPLTSKFDVILSKTGFTNPAGGCLVMIINSSVGQRILILLGSKNMRSRIPDMERLVKEL